MLMMPRLPRMRVAALMLVALCVVSAATARPLALAQSTFPPGAVVSITGTPHLYIADGSGVLHWGGDTRALSGRTIDWNTRIEISVDTLKTLQLGDPWLSAGLLKDGIPIYLVKWENTEPTPTLLHIQSIDDVRLFGINTNNYGNFVMDPGQWQARFNIPVSSLPRGELAPIPGSGPSGPSSQCPSPSAPTKPTVQISQTDLASLEPILEANGSTACQINVSKTVSLATGAGPIVLVAPLATAPSSTASDVSANRSVLLGVLQTAQDLSIASATLPHNIYLVKVDTGQVAFVNPQNQEIRSARSLDVRSFTRQLPAPRAILTTQDVCFGWNQVQVCGDPIPVPVDTQNNLQQAMGPVVSSLQDSGIIPEDQISTRTTLSEAEGTTAVNNRRGNVLAAPAKSVAQVRSGTVPNNTLLGVFAVTDTLAASGYQVPAGNYAVFSAGGSQAKLMTADGQTMTVPMRLVQVRAPATNQQDPPIAIIANFCFGSGGDTDVCFFGEGED